MEVEKLQRVYGEEQKKQIKEDLAVQEAITLLVNESVEDNLFWYITVP